MAALQGFLFVIISLSALAENFYITESINQPARYAGFLLTAAGLIIFIVSLVNFGELVTPNPYPKEHYTLKTTGLYSLIRHPIYFSVLLMFTGSMLILNSFYSLLLIPPLFVFLTQKIKFEEKHLSQKFPGYIEYKRITRKIIPYIY